MGRLRVFLPLGVGVLVAAMILVFWLRKGNEEAGGSGRTVVATAKQLTQRPEPADFTPYAAEITGMRPGADDRSVIIEVSLPAGRPDCARDLRVEMIQDREPDRPNVVYANVIFSSADASEQGACPEHQPAEVTMRVRDPLANRSLVFNAGDAWTPDGARYRKCDKTLGCHPPADHCDPVWVDQAVLTLDVPVKHVRGVRTVRGCDGTWLVMDVNPAVGDCPPVDGIPNCTVTPRISRWFMRFGAQGWAEVTVTKENGCAPVHSVQPAFPTSLCANLPAVG